MDRDEVEVHNSQKRTRPISSHLDRTNLVNKGLIIWLSGKFYLRDTAGSPERARWLHLVRLGSQSPRAIGVILSTSGASHILKDLLLALMNRAGGLYVRENLDRCRKYRPNAVRSVHTTEVKILPYRPT